MTIPHELVGSVVKVEERRGRPLHSAESCLRCVRPLEMLSPGCFEHVDASMHRLQPGLLFVGQLIMGRDHPIDVAEGVSISCRKRAMQVSARKVLGQSRTC